MSTSTISQEYGSGVEVSDRRAPDCASDGTVCTGMVKLLVPSSNHLAALDRRVPSKGSCPFFLAIFLGPGAPEGFI